MSKPAGYRAKRMPSRSIRSLNLSKADTRPIVSGIGPGVRPACVSSMARTTTSLSGGRLLVILLSDDIMDDHSLQNVDERTVDSFGAEWRHFDQSAVASRELDQLFQQYFRIFPWSKIPHDAVGFDAGVGSGRWARRVAARIGRLHCLDASSDALDVARRSLADMDNVYFELASLGSLPFATNSMDMGYCLGVLHHLPQPEKGLAECVRALKPGAPLLVYVYYALDERPLWFRAIWHASDGLRRAISRLPPVPKRWVTNTIALVAYFPLARLARLLHKLGRAPDNLPLSFYRNRSFYTMRTDALDRFGTPVEKRFSIEELRTMMNTCGLSQIEVSTEPPYWCAVGIKTDYASVAISS